MIKFPAVDVVIVSLDFVDDTINAIESVLAQRGVRPNIVVVDQGSASRSLEALRSFCAQHGQVTLLCNRDDIGLSAGRNQGAELGDSEFIVALDAGAEFVDSNQLARGCAVMKARHELGVLAFRIVQKGSDEDLVSAWIYPQAQQQWGRQRFKTDRFSGLGHMLRRRVFEDLRGYDAVLIGLHDEVDFAKRVINDGFTIEYTPRATIAWHGHEGYQALTEKAHWQLDVRNRTYMHLKFRSGLKAFIHHILQVCGHGYRGQHLWATCVGLVRGMLLAPHAMHVRRVQPAIYTTDEARAYVQSCKHLRNDEAGSQVHFESAIVVPEVASADSGQAEVSFRIEGQEIRRV